MKKQFNSPENDNNWVILEGGMKAQVLTNTNVDSQFLESRRYGNEDMCRLFAMSPNLMFEARAATSWGTGLAEQQPEP